MRSRPAGFTLIEVLLATVLLAAGLALAFATLHSATQMVGRGEAQAQRNERMRAVEGFLRARIGSAQPIAFEIDENTQRGLRFVGEPQRMRFVADLPDYLGRGGPYLHDVSVDDEGNLQVAFAMTQAGKTLQDEWSRVPESLADKLKRVRFFYRGLNQDGKPGEWSERWEAADVLPLQVAVEIEAEDGGEWPKLVVGLSGYGGGIAGPEASQ